MRHTVEFNRLRDRYFDAHQRGMASLARRDFHGVAEALRDEAAVITEQRLLMTRVARRFGIVLRSDADR